MEEVVWELKEKETGRVAAGKMLAAWWYLFMFWRSCEEGAENPWTILWGLFM